MGSVVRARAGPTTRCTLKRKASIPLLSPPPFLLALAAAAARVVFPALPRVCPGRLGAAGESSARLDWRFAASSVGKEPLPGRHTPHPHARRSRRWRPLACSPRRAAVPQRALPCLSPIVWRAHAAGALAQSRGACSTSLCFYIFARLLYFYCRLSTDSQQLWCRSPVRF